MVIKSLNKNKSSDEHSATISSELIEDVKNIGLNPKSFLTK